jgi:hypothetical protein
MDICWTILNILQQFRTFFGQLVYLVLIWYIFPVFGLLHHGNPASGPDLKDMI